MGAGSVADTAEKKLRWFTHVETSARKLDCEVKLRVIRREEQCVTIKHEVVQKTVLPRLPRSTRKASCLWQDAATRSGAAEVTRAGHAAQVANAEARRVRPGKTFPRNSPGLAECRFLLGRN